MKLFNSVGPNPKVVRMYMAERGLKIDQKEIDIIGGENRQSDYVKINPGGGTPALELDNGNIIAEITCICEYLDELEGGSSLIGTTPEERAETRMWVRRIDLGILEPLTNGFRYAEGEPMFKDRMTLMTHAASDLKALAQEKITWLDDLMNGKDFICGDRFTLADIMLFVFLEFGMTVGQPLNKDNENICALFEKIAARPSAKA
jgi:glutathione S-transferase